MIGDKKEFGAYVLTSSTEYYRDELHDSPHEREELGGCCIPNSWTLLSLIAVKKYNYNASIFTFELPYKNRRLDLPPGAALLVKVPGVEHGGGDAIRPYTSVSEDSRRGSFDILVKRYDEWGDDPNKSKNEGNPYYVKNPNYKPPGAVSTFIHSLNIGESLSFKYSEICFSKVSLELLGVTMEDLVRDPNSIRGMKKIRSTTTKGSAPSAVVGPAKAEAEIAVPDRTNTIRDSVFAHMMRLGTNPTALFNNLEGSDSPRCEDTECRASVANTEPPHSDRESTIDQAVEDEEKVEEEDERSCFTDKATLDGGGSFYSQYEETKEETPVGNAEGMRLQLVEPSPIKDMETNMAPTPPSRPRPSKFRPSLGGAASTMTRGRSDSTSTSSRGHTPPKQGEGEYSHSCAPIDLDEEVSSGENNFKIATPPRSVVDTKYPGSDKSIRKLTLLAVGAGVSPMLRILRAALDFSSKLETVTFCYGVREVKDILMREALEQLANSHSSRFKLVYCVGSRYSNMHFAAKKKDEYMPPPEPEGFSLLDKFEVNVRKKLGWIDEEAIREHAPEPADDHKVVVCGLPGVYDRLCGSRFQPYTLSSDSILAKLGFKVSHVIKL